MEQKPRKDGPSPWGFPKTRWSPVWWRTLAQKNRVSLAQTLKIGAAMLRWNRALKKDPWGELGRIADFVCEWKKGDST